MINNQYFPLVSIIIPVYNAESYLAKCIQSVLNQDYQNWEMIIIDDGSGDNSLGICKKMQKKDSRISIYTQENRGVSSARNYGLKHMKGQFVLFIDSDDYIEKKYISQLTHAIIHSSADIVFSNGTRGEMTIDTFSRLVNEGAKNGCLCKEDVLAVWKKMFRRNIIIDNNIQFDETMKMAEDTAFLISLFPLCSRYYLISELGYKHILRPNSVTTSYHGPTTAHKLFDYYKKNLEISTLSHPNLFDWVFFRAAYFKISFLMLHFNIKKSAFIVDILKNRLLFIYAISCWEKVFSFFIQKGFLGLIAFGILSNVKHIIAKKCSFLYRQYRIFIYEKD